MRLESTCKPSKEHYVWDWNLSANRVKAWDLFLLRSYRSSYQHWVHWSYPDWCYATMVYVVRILEVIQLFWILKASAACARSDSYVICAAQDGVKVRFHTAINRADFVCWCMLYTYEGYKMHSWDNSAVGEPLNHIH